MNKKAPLDRTRPIDTDQKYLKKRFEFYFEKGDEGECWEWERAIVGGYGAFTIGNTQYRAPSCILPTRDTIGGASGLLFEAEIMLRRDGYEAVQNVNSTMRYSNLQPNS